MSSLLGGMLLVVLWDLLGELSGIGVEDCHMVLYGLDQVGC